jgi:tripartite-type tricarboxylate transporter receptor subunit TctC
MISLVTISPSGAEGFPDRPLHIVVPQGPGGSSGMTARTVAMELNKFLDKNTVVENKPGDNGLLAIADVARAKPDGYRIGIQCLSPLLAELTGHPMGFSPNDLVPVALAGSVDIMIVASPKTGVTTWQGLVERARNAPRKLAFGYASAWVNRISISYLMKRAGIEMKLVPYKGESEAAVDLLGGQIDFSIQSPGVASSFIKAGTMTPILVLSKTRNPILPDVSALGDDPKEVFSAESTCSFVVPKGVPEATIEKLNKAFNQAGRSPDLAKALTQFGLGTRIGGSLEDVTRTLADTRKKWEATGALLDLKQFQ